MNGNDLMDAFSGLDPKYIDEAAFELHDIKITKKNKKVTGIRKGLFIILPAAAVIFLVVMTAIPLMRMSKSGSSYESGAEAESSYEEAAEVTEYDSAAAEAAEAEEDAMAAEAAEAESLESAAEDSAAAEYAAEAAQAESLESAAEDSAAAEYAAEAEEAEYAAEAGDTGGNESAAESEYAATADEISNSAKAASKAEEYDSAAAEKPVFKAAYDNGIITPETGITLPAGYKNSDYIIKGIDDTGSEKVYARGVLGDIVDATDPLKIDISALDLPEGTYTLTFEEEVIEFTVT